MTEGCVDVAPRVLAHTPLAQVDHAWLAVIPAENRPSIPWEVEARLLAAVRVLTEIRLPKLHHIRRPVLQNATTFKYQTVQQASMQAHKLVWCCDQDVDIRYH